MEDYNPTQSSDLLGINSLDLRSDGGFVEHSGIDSCFDVTMSSGLDCTMTDAPPLDEEAALDQRSLTPPLFAGLPRLGNGCVSLDAPLLDEEAAIDQRPLTPPLFAGLPEAGNASSSNEDAQILAETVALPLSEDEGTLERNNGMPVPFVELPLSDDICEELFSHEFDPHWLTAYNVDPAVLQSFTSPKKLETLISQGVLKIGDDLAIINQEEQVEIVKTATILSFSVKTQYRPTLCIELDGVFQENLTACHGPSFIVQAFNNIDRGKSTVPRKAWKDIELFRGRVWVESLHYVRNSFHLWEEQRKAWEHRLEGTTPVAPKGRCKWNRRG